MTRVILRRVCVAIIAIKTQQCQQYVFSVVLKMQQWVPFVLQPIYKIFHTHV